MSFLYFYKETDFKFGKHGIKLAVFKHLNRAGRKEISSNKIATLYLSFSFISFQQSTYQLTLVTNGTSSYAIYSYEDGGMQWTSRLGRRCAVGYATKNGAQFYEEEDSFSENIFSIDSKEFDVNGVRRRGFFCKSLNTPGEPIQLTNEQKCMNWYNAEPDPDSWLEELSDCPATRRTARRDNRYRRIRSSRDIECYELRWPTRRYLASHQCCYFRRGRRRNAFVSDPPLAGRAYRSVQTKSLNHKNYQNRFSSLHQTMLKIRLVITEGEKTWKRDWLKTFGLSRRTLGFIDRRK